eukprot:326570-Pleurochrysis_carterae.AAC.1
MNVENARKTRNEAYAAHARSDRGKQHTDSLNGLSAYEKKTKSADVDQNALESNAEKTKLRADELCKTGDKERAQHSGVNATLSQPQTTPRF